MRSLFKTFGKQQKEKPKKIVSDLIYFTRRCGKSSLSLSGYELTSIPQEINNLHQIQTLDLSNNKLNQISEGLEKLLNLEILNLSGNEFSVFPNPSSLPPNLKKIILRQNKIKSIDLRDRSILDKLLYLDLEDNEIISFYYSSSTQGELREVNLRGNKVADLWIENNPLLESLILSHNGIRSLTTNFSSLHSLKRILLDHNSLRDVPQFVFDASNVEFLNLSSNKIHLLSPSLTNLLSLERLLLNENEISELPSNISRLSKLEELQVSKNRIKCLPAEISRLSKLNVIEVYENPIETPPKAVVEQGGLAIQLFLREIDSQNIEGYDHRLWTSKLMIVGEGGVGKTSLVKALKEETYNSTEDTTHGIRIETIELPHPSDSSIEMHLNIWDFGGQQIYHATHQFFLTDNSIFLFVWNARTEFNQGRPYYWLDMITANAPNAPIILVSTHLDQRRDQIPLDYLKEKYPRITLFFEISNLDKRGINALREHVQQLASKLPLMGKPWPAKWDDVIVALRENPEKVISRQKFRQIFHEFSLDKDTAEILAKYLNDLGEVLQYPESPTLKDLIILKPQWISEYISKILTADSVIDRGGMLTQEEVSKQWHDIDKPTQELFLELMEQYDLAYRIPNDSINRAIVVERLNPDRPEGYSSWRQLLERKDLGKIELEYKLSSMQPGLPTWFIARTHRFSQGIHWRRGAIFADKEGRNYALVETFDQEKLIRLTVIGSSPHNFMSILKDGLEYTFGRYPGMKVDSFVPCPEENESSPCQGRYLYSNLENALLRGREALTCQSCFSDVQINQLLFGIGGSTVEVINKLDEKLFAINQLLPDDTTVSEGSYEGFGRLEILIRRMHQNIEDVVAKQAEMQNTELRNVKLLLEGFVDHFELLHRNFAIQFKELQSREDSHCPSTFLFKGIENSSDCLNNSLELHLFCQCPKHLHPATFPIEGDEQYQPYIIKQPKQWLITVFPYINAMIQVMKYAPLIPISPLEKPSELMAKCLEHMELTMEQVEKLAVDSKVTVDISYNNPSKVDGAQLRELHKLLKNLDPSNTWQGLKKKFTPEGHYLWLCPYHHKHFDEIS